MTTTTENNMRDFVELFCSSVTIDTLIDCLQLDETPHPLMLPIHIESYFQFLLHCCIVGIEISENERQLVRAIFNVGAHNLDYSFLGDCLR